MVTIGGSMAKVKEGSTDVLVVGAGPAGLAAGAAVMAEGRRAILLETGPSLRGRDHDRPDHLASGVGGCGLFSDGKFSFFPSATRLWRLDDRDVLRESWAWLFRILSDHGIEPPPFPSDATVPLDRSETRKRYPSFYLPFNERRAIIAELEQSAAQSLLTQTTVQSIAFEPANGAFVAVVDGRHTHQISARAVVLASGRYGPLALSSIFPPMPTVFRRLEIGVRIVQPSDSFFLADDPSLDPKVIIREGAVEWRTFCCCRNGEVVTIPSMGILSVSGRADGRHSSVSNVGFNVRLLDEALANDIQAPLLERISSLTDPVQQHVRSFLSPRSHDCRSGPVSELLGSTLSALLHRGLELLESHAPGVGDDGGVLVAPALEGVGRYPRLVDLQVSPYPLWVAGDCTGEFRGLTAAMLSGYYCGVRASRHP